MDLCRDPGVQLQLLDSIAGTSPAAGAFAQLWAQLQDLRQQLAAARQLADPAKRDALQLMVDQVSCSLMPHTWVGGCCGPCVSSVQ